MILNELQRRYNIGEDLYNKTNYVLKLKSIHQDEQIQELMNFLPLCLKQEYCYQMYESKIKRIKLLQDSENLFPKNDGIVLDKTGISLLAAQFEIKTFKPG